MNTSPDYLKNLSNIISFLENENRTLILVFEDYIDTFIEFHTRRSGKLGIKGDQIRAYYKAQYVFNSGCETPEQAYGVYLKNIEGNISLLFEYPFDTEVKPEMIDFSNLWFWNSIQCVRGKQFGAGIARNNLLKMQPVIAKLLEDAKNFLEKESKK